MQLLDDLSIPQKGREHMLALDDVQKRELLQNHQGARADGKRKGRHAATSAPGLGSPPATSAPGLGSPCEYGMPGDEPDDRRSRVQNLHKPMPCVAGVLLPQLHCD